MPRYLPTRSRSASNALPNAALLTAAVVAALTAPVAAQLQFDELPGHGLPALFDHTTDIVLGDVDGDGDLDILSANFQGGHPSNPIPGQTQLYLNDGRGVYGSATATNMPTFSDNVAALALGDVDGDGDLDLLSGSLGGQNKLYVNNGLGVFTDVTAQQMPALNDVTFGVALGDVDGDGDLDLVVGNTNYYRQNRLYLNNGAGTFTDVTATQLPVDADHTSDVGMGDVDGDGDLDIVFGNSPEPDRLYLNNGAGVFTDCTATHMPGTFDMTCCISMGDVDGDGDLDLLFGNGPDFGQGRNRLYLNSGTGVFTDVTPTHMPGALSRAGTVVLGDLDADGDLDAFVGNGVYGGPNSLYLNDGTGVFDDVATPRLVSTQDAAFGAAIGDVDRDGDLDIVVGNDTYYGNSAQNRLYLNLQRQLNAPTTPQIGQPYSLDAYMRYGTSSTVDIAAVYLSTAAVSIPLGTLGTLGIDPALAVPFPTLIIPQPSGVASVGFTVPNASSLVRIGRSTSGSDHPNPTTPRSPRHDPVKPPTSQPSTRAFRPKPHTLGRPLPHSDPAATT